MTDDPRTVRFSLADVDVDAELKRLHDAANVHAGIIDSLRAENRNLRDALTNIRDEARLETEASTHPFAEWAYERAALAATEEPDGTT